ncbi:MAG: alpha/beta fold hydrolase [Streptosporangiaceae bacterium]
MEVRVPVPGGTLWAEDTGGGRTPVVFIHADWTDSRIWDPVIPLLRERYRLIRYDLRGFGWSSRAAQPFTRLGDLQALLGHLGIRDAVVVGHSGGGGTALGLALQEPGRVGSLVLVAPGMHDYPWPADDPFYRECSLLIAAHDGDGLVRLGLRTWAPGGTSDVIIAMMRGAAASWFDIGDLEQEDPPGFARLAEISIPAVMLLGGREYPMVSQVSRAIAAELRSCREVPVPGADHLLPLRDPIRLAQAISETAG